MGFLVRATRQCISCFKLYPIEGICNAAVFLDVVFYYWETERWKAHWSFVNDQPPGLGRLAVFKLYIKPQGSFHKCRSATGAWLLQGILGQITKFRLKHSLVIHPQRPSLLKQLQPLDASCCFDSIMAVTCRQALELFGWNSFLIYLRHPLKALHFTVNSCQLWVHHFYVTTSQLLPHR